MTWLLRLKLAVNAIVFHSSIEKSSDCRNHPFYDLDRYSDDLGYYPPFPPTASSPSADQDDPIMIEADSPGKFSGILTK
jgi:hypothetical protein